MGVLNISLNKTKRIFNVVIKNVDVINNFALF